MPRGIWIKFQRLAGTLIIRDENEIAEFSSQIGVQGTIVVIENLDRVIDIDGEKKAKINFIGLLIKRKNI